MGLQINLDRNSNPLHALYPNAYARIMEANYRAQDGKVDIRIGIYADKTARDMSGQIGQSNMQMPMPGNQGDLIMDERQSATTGQIDAYTSIHGATGYKGLISQCYQWLKANSQKYGAGVDIFETGQQA